MHPRPPYRWKSFWFGMLVLAFLGWAWARSISRDDALRAHPGMGPARGASRPWYLLRSAGGSAWWEMRRDPIGTSSSPRFEFHSDVGRDAYWFQPPFRHYTATMLARGADPAFSYTAIAYWLLILLYLIPRTSFLVWRWRKSKRLADPPLAP